jgi:hypothetical protein
LFLEIGIRDGDAIKRSIVGYLHRFAVVYPVAESDPDLIIPMPPQPDKTQRNIHRNES